MAAIVAHDGPQVTGLGPAPARIEHGRPRLVHKQAAGLLHQRAHALDERRQMESDRSHPVRQHGAIKQNPVAGEHLRLAIKRHMFAELRDSHLRQQRLGRNAVLHQMGGRGGLGDPGEPQEQA